MNTDTYNLIEAVLDQLVAMPDPQPSLAQLGASVGLSEFHFQRLFKDWVGISPKKFMQHLTLQAAKERLRASASVLDASYDAGLSGPGRLHDLMINIEAMTPREYKMGGQGLDIYFGRHATPFGDCTLYLTDRGVCGLEFLSGKDQGSVYRQRWPKANFLEAPDRTGPVIERIFYDRAVPQQIPLSVYLAGSKFQVQVWQALLSIPSGGVLTYGDIAENIKMGRKGARAVGTAIGANPIGWLIPCHRVIRKNGALSGYRWGETRKLAMLGWEASQTEKRAAG